MRAIVCVPNYRAETSQALLMISMLTFFYLYDVHPKLQLISRFNLHRARLLPATTQSLPVYKRSVAALGVFQIELSEQKCHIAKLDVRRPCETDYCTEGVQGRYSERR